MKLIFILYCDLKIAPISSPNSDHHCVLGTSNLHNSYEQLKKMWYCNDIQCMTMLEVYILIYVLNSYIRKVRGETSETKGNPFPYTIISCILSKIEKYTVLDPF